MVRPALARTGDRWGRRWRSAELRTLYPAPQRSSLAPIVRNPRRRAFLSAAAIVVGIGSVLIAFLLPDDPARVAVPIVLGCGGLMGVIFGGWTLNGAVAAFRAERSLRQGKAVIGRWHVTPELWEQFVALNETFSTNQVAVPRAVPTEGSEVIFGPAAFLVGDQVELLNRTAVVGGRAAHWGGDWTVTRASLGGDRPTCLYLYAAIRGATAPPTFNNIIVPVPAGAISEASRVRDHFLASIQLSP